MRWPDPCGLSITHRLDLLVHPYLSGTTATPRLRRLGLDHRHPGIEAEGRRRPDIVIEHTRPLQVTGTGPLHLLHLQVVAIDPEQRTFTMTLPKRGKTTTRSLEPLGPWQQIGKRIE